MMKYLLSIIACLVLAVSCGSKGPKMIIPAEGQNEIRMKIGDTLRLTGNSHSSVGLSSMIHLDSKAFSMQQEKVYDHPENVSKGMAGADKAQIIYTLVATQSGEFEIENVEMFRGKPQKSEKYTVKVK